MQNYSGIVQASQGITPGAVVTVTAVTAIDWAIPAGVRIITFIGDQLNIGANPTLLRFGTSSGIVTAGYGSQASYTQSSNQVGASGFSTVGMSVPSISNGQASDTVRVVLSRLEGSNTWVFSGINHQSGQFTNILSGGRVALGSGVTTLRYTAQSGGNLTAGGLVHILWEF